MSAPTSPSARRATRRSLEGVSASLTPGFQTRAGLSTFTVWVDPADAPAASSDPLPDRIALECGDGTFQAYRRVAG